MQEQVINITPEPVQLADFDNRPRQLADIAARIVDLMRQREELAEAIRDQYQKAAELGAPKPGFKLAVAHSRMEAEKLEEIRRGYEIGAGALGLQGDLFDG